MGFKNRSKKGVLFWFKSMLKGINHEPFVCLTLRTVNFCSQPTDPFFIQVTFVCTSILYRWVFIMRQVEGLLPPEELFKVGYPYASGGVHQPLSNKPQMSCTKL